MKSSRLAILSVAASSLLTLSGCPSQDAGPSVGGGGGTSAQPQLALNTPVKTTNPPPAVAVRPQPASADEVVATVDGATVSMQQLQAPLIEAYGLNMLMKLVELQMARQDAARAGIIISQKDVADETQRYLDNVFKDDKKLSEMRDELDQKTRENRTAEAEKLRADMKQEEQRLLTQLLEQQKVTPTDFNIAMQTTTYLRRIVQPAVQVQLTDANLEERFRVRYGEKVQVRHIALANMQEVNEAKRRLAAGDPFTQVAADMSRNRQTASLGGELPPFSRSASGYPEGFKDTAFVLKNPGDISDPVEADGSFHLIQLVARIAPTAVKFEDVKEGVREDLAETLTDAAVRQLRTQLGQEALKGLKIQNPVLAKQFEAKVTQRDTTIRDRDQIRRELKAQRPATTAAAASEPAPEAHAAPATTPTATKASTTTAP